MNIKTRDMALIALFAALTAIGAFIKIPTPLVPFTLQYLFCAYSGILLGAKRGLYSQLLYLSVGLMGFPVFTQGGGPMYIFQPTFGYIIGFSLCAYIIGKLTERLDKITLTSLLGPILAGMSIVYSCGIIHLYLIMNFYLGKPMSFKAAVIAGLFPFVFSDLIYSVAIALTATAIVPSLRKLGLADEPR
ncbi:biotin transporter BioY [Tepidanaerobacter syntrophicus]|uniref:Biotin transporter n=1 Tax=Tepidanaerobacter syntrophicus TaxID=224999 RepID=A0A0U9HPL8_9FIRM|nr:biotin transporter BioY [Tepidanaerobacter syntrophicus]GAQ24951.1 biotin transport system substrate-specific component [Tepidanaerobacter syntrophicus]HHV82261.1 biotin transporter BioY [Tepidanaerobacter syntrophicus]